MVIKILSEHEHDTFSIRDLDDKHCLYKEATLSVRIPYNSVDRESYLEHKLVRSVF